ncbi:MAG: hypothetical protein AB7L09_02615 [Nitrospira sp.]
MNLPEPAIEIFNRVSALAPEYSNPPLRQLDPSESGVRRWQIGDFHFQVHMAIPAFWSMSSPKFGSVRKVMVQRGVDFSHFTKRSFFLDIDNPPSADGGSGVGVIEEHLDDLLMVLRTRMVLSDLCNAVDHQAPVVESITDDGA